MNYGTREEFTTAVKQALEAGRYHEAARIMTENPEATTGYWLDWAFALLAGKSRAIPSKKLFQIPLLKDGDLFGEPITTEKLMRKKRD